MMERILNNKWLKIALLAVLGLVLAGGLVFAGVEIGKKQVQTKLSLFPTPTIIPTITSDQPTLTVKQYGGMLMAECKDRNYISDTADYIIEGAVRKVENKWNKEKTVIFTYSDLVIENILKGLPFAENKLQIVTPGGCVEGICMEVENQPISHMGKRVRIYVKETDEEFLIICGQLGVEEIQ